MRKLLFLLLVVMASVAVRAEHHAVEVQRFNQWASKYLTVANTWGGLCLTVESGQLPKCMDVITEVDGVTTEGMPSGTFYEIWNNADVVNLKCLRKQGGKIVEFSCKVKDMAKSVYFPGGIQFLFADKLANNVEFVSDADIDYFYFNTYDIDAGTEDPLVMKNVLSELATTLEARGMARDRQNPDIIISAKKSLVQNAKVSSQVVQRGGESHVAQNVWTGQKFLVTNNDHETVTTTNVEATFHIAVTLIDGKKKRQNPSSNPIVWQLNYDKYSDKSIDLMSEVKNYVKFCCANYPFDVPRFSPGFYSAGIVLRNEDDLRSGEILSVLNGTDAYNKGLRGGDVVEKAYVKGGFALVFWLTRATYFKANKNVRKGRRWFFLLPGIPMPAGYLKSPSDYLTRAPEDIQALSSVICYSVRHENGNSQKITGLFEKSFFPCEYILTDN